MNFCAAIDAEEGGGVVSVISDHDFRFAPTRYLGWGYFNVPGRVGSTGANFVDRSILIQRTGTKEPGINK